MVITNLYLVLSAGKLISVSLCEAGKGGSTAHAAQLGFLRLKNAILLIGLFRRVKEWRQVECQKILTKYFAAVARVLSRTTQHVIINYVLPTR